MTAVADHSGTADDAAFAVHERGKIELRSKRFVHDNATLALAYTPGVARVASAIARDPDLSWRYTWRANAILIVTDGTAVLGLGDIGPVAALPVMEGKAQLFKEFADVDCIPICLATTDVQEIVETVVRIAPAYGGVNLEDISAPRCFEIERELQSRLDIPVFHDDQHGTAIVVAAALKNACLVTGKAHGSLRIVVSGAGAAGVAITAMLQAAGFGDIVVCDRRGILHPGRHDLSAVKQQLALRTNADGLRGGIDVALRGADVFIGVSGGTIPIPFLLGMAPGSIVFSLANPTPEVHPDEAHEAGAAVVATGRSDFPNQINNVLAFPGVFRGVLDAGATCITDGMKLAAVDAIASLVAEDLAPDRIVPDPFHPQLARCVAAAVREEAVRERVVRGRLAESSHAATDRRDTSLA